MKKNAFTLAEVLITLGIIGVVAAMTLPTLIQNYQKQVYVNGLKKAISTSQNMLKQMQADEGASDLSSTKLFMDGVRNVGTLEEDSYGNLNPVGDDIYGNPEVFAELIPKYIKVIKTCRADACSQQYTIARLTHNNNKTQNVQVKTAANVWEAWQDQNDKVKNAIIGFYTVDGPIYYIAPRAGYGPDKPNYIPLGVIVMVDVNGNKGPNIQNVDLFSFVINYNGVIDDLYSDSVFYLMSNGWKMDY